ncbi:hypothetical protein KKR91_01960 [Arthrobacter jiangjiafuii]|uniref:Uncharacterized protein n=1 Tax=Arthrobacter jiangjiafuii TaxID=2817475 RepID=A0A975R006_9MICC|nr:hypothetical protein [Arthrobacter jiangjiafuii]QWC10445.1 hypothetical protein KKR91_01960 [Arthrobacter jiangjiafuii]
MAPDYGSSRAIYHTSNNGWHSAREFQTATCIVPLLNCRLDNPTMRPTVTNLQRGSRFAIVIENWDNAFDMENTYGITFNDVSTLKTDESNIWSREPGFPLTGEVTTGVWTHVRGSWDLTKSDTNKLPTTNQNCIREGQLTGTQRPGPALFRAHTKSDDAFFPYDPAQASCPSAT